MSTRSITNIIDAFSSGTTCTFYKHFDGYPLGLGRKLLSLLKGKSIVNGKNKYYKKGVTYNGTSALAVDLMYYLSQESDDVYSIPTDSRDLGEEYIYEISWDDINCEFVVEVEDIAKNKKFDLKAY